MKEKVFTTPLTEEEKEKYFNDVSIARVNAVYKLIASIEEADISELVEIVKILRIELGEASEINKNINETTFIKKEGEEN